MWTAVDSVARRPHTVTGVRDMVSHPSPIPTTHFLSLHLFFMPAPAFIVSIFPSIHLSALVLLSVCFRLSAHVSLTWLFLSFTSYCLSKHLLPDSLTFPNLSNVVSSFLLLFLHLSIYSPHFSVSISNSSLSLSFIHTVIRHERALWFRSDTSAVAKATAGQSP